MAVSPIGNAIIVNQNIPVAASQQNLAQNRIDLQNVAAGEIVKDEQKKVEETRPTEQSSEINAEEEKKKQEGEQKHTKKENEEEETEEQNNPPSPEHLLDVKA